jgi:heat shock protein HtpX
VWAERARRAVAFRLDPAALARQRRLNRLHSALILLSLVGLAGWTGLLVSGLEGLAFGAGIALAFLLLDPMPGDLLFRHAFGAVRLSPAQAPDLIAMAAALARRAGLPRPPTVYFIPSPMLQAMAAGSREAPAVAVTSDYCGHCHGVNWRRCWRMKSRISGMATCWSCAWRPRRPS